MSTDFKISASEILKMIPHRYPFLLVDKVVELVEGDRIVGVKNVTFNEPQFMGHFPDMPIMPGVLIIEALAQVSAILVSKTLSAKPNEKTVYFMAIDSAKFRKIVEPGDTMYLYSKIEQNRGAVWKFSGYAEVDGKKVAESSFTAMLKDKD
ncbi:MAG: 3-hydroxyacyl-ACP dehydratase FabZ [Rickettsiaceae bacterium]|nr:3-hydroxyacyl-ACP dehydratase FabZ [Rickettsiaceae bacterium]